MSLYKLLTLVYITPLVYYERCVNSWEMVASICEYYWS